MATAAASITDGRERPKPDRAPDLTVDALIARMGSAAARAAAAVLPTRDPGDQCHNEPPDSMKFIQLQVEFNQALVAAIASITEHLKQSRDIARPAPEKQLEADIIARVDCFAVQISDLAQRLDQAVVALHAADHSQRTLIDAISARLETLCQITAAAQQQAAAQFNDFQQRSAANQAAVEQISHELALAGHHGQNQLAESELRLLRLERDLRKIAKTSPASSDFQQESNARQPSAGMPDTRFDYFLFEHRFRGPTEEIKHRQRAYLDYFVTAESVLDLGCGRGEFVELLVERGAQVIGVDLNEDMVDFCKARRLPVLQGDLFEFLAAQSDGSFGGIFVSQVVEHLPPDEVWKLIQLAAEKLRVEGVLLLETVNPQCFPAISCFYLDPSHVRPYHAGLLAFMCQQAGLQLECIQFSAPLLGASGGAILKSRENVPPVEAVEYQDYAVIARRTSIPLQDRESR